MKWDEARRASEEHLRILYAEHAALLNNIIKEPDPGERQELRTALAEVRQGILAEKRTRIALDKEGRKA